MLLFTVVPLAMVVWFAFTDGEGSFTLDNILVIGENLVFPQTHSFSMYSLAALLPLLPAKQRPLDGNDWMLSDSVIACPDPNCGAKFKITRIGKRTFRHGECTVEKIAVQE